MGENKKKLTCIMIYFLLSEQVHNWLLKFNMVLTL